LESIDADASEYLSMTRVHGAFILLISLACAIASAQKFEPLGQPCRGFNVLASRVVLDPEGHEWFVLSNSNETTGVELIFVDFKTNTGKTYRAPAGSGAWSLNQVVGDRLIVGTYYDGKMMVFDLKTMSFTKVIPFPGEEYFWNAAIGSDGRLYGGTYPGAKLGALDLNTLALEDCGAPAAPNLYLRNISALPDGRLLCNFVTSKPTTKIYDPKTKQWSDPPAAMKHVQRGVVWNGHFLAATAWDGGDATGVIAFKGDDLQPVDPPPFPIPAGKTKWNVDLNLTDAQTLYLKQKEKIWRFRAGEKKLTKVFDQGISSAAITAVASDGTLLGIRGQDYLVTKPGELTASLLRIPVEPAPRPMHFIAVDDRNRLWGGPPFGQTMFWMDLATKKAVNTGIVTNAGGEVYDVAFKDGKTYAVSYVGGDIIEFDADQPWDQLGNKNPRLLAHLTDRGYIRPVGGVEIGNDGKLYSGWMAKYGSYGGAIAVTDLPTGETRLIENPLGQQGISAIALDGKFIYAGTTLAANGLPNKPNEKPQFGMIDAADGKVVFQEAVAGGVVSQLRYDAKTRLVAMVCDRALRIFDPASKTFTNAASPTVNAGALDGIGDGSIWFGSENKLVRYDLKDATTQSFDAPAKVERVCVAKDGAVFIASGPDVYRIKPEVHP
jgi:streptogramin lyase